MYLPLVAWRVLREGDCIDGVNEPGSCRGNNVTMIFFTTVSGIGPVPTKTDT